MRPTPDTATRDYLDAQLRIAAAAPELLEKLREVRDFLSTLFYEDGAVGAETLAYEIDDVISRATGTQQETGT